MVGSQNNTVSVPAGLKNILPADVPISVIVYNKSTLFSQTSASIGSSVLSLTIGGIASGQTISPAIQVGLAVSATSLNSTRTCAYYEFETSSWKTDGCMIIPSASSSTNVVCACTHLTNFAVLLDFQGNEAQISVANALALGEITTIGCSISVILMGCTMFIFLFFKV